MERPETRMIDVSAKRETSRLAIARARLKMNRKIRFPRATCWRWRRQPASWRPNRRPA
jgi:ribosomal protein L32E